MYSDFETDAEALWQDTIDLLEDQNISEPLAAMLKSCKPISLQDGILTISTSMRLVQKTVLKNSATIENCLSQAAFENITLEVVFTTQSETKTSVPQPSPEPSRDDDLWDDVPQAPSKKQQNPLKPKNPKNLRISRRRRKC